MNTARLCIAALGLTTSLASTGCLCGNREEHAVTLSAGSEGLTLIADGSGERIPVEWRFTSNQADASAFEFVVDALNGSRAGEGVALTAFGYDATSNYVSLTMALPVSLQQGDVYTVGSTFTVDVGVNDPRAWGAHDLQQSNQADVAFSIAKYTFPPPAYDVSFRAVTSSGTIQVTQRTTGHVELLLSLSFADGSGRKRYLNGPVRVNLETFNASCA